MTFFYCDIFLSFLLRHFSLLRRFIKYLETSRLYLHHIIYTLNLWESPKSAECNVGYELFLAVFQHRFYFTALPVVCARVKLEWVKRKKKRCGQGESMGDARTCTVLSRGLSRSLASRRRSEAERWPSRRGQE